MPPVNSEENLREEIKQYLFQALGFEVPEFVCAIYQDDHEGVEFGTYYFSEQTSKFFGKDITDELFESLRTNYIVLSNAGSVIGIDEGMHSDVLTRVVNTLIEYARQMGSTGRYEPDSEVMEDTWRLIGFKSYEEEGLRRGAISAD